MSRFAPAGAALLAALAAWLSPGTIGLSAEDGPRLGALPASPLAAAAATAAAIVVLVFARAGASMAPVALLVLTLLPWLPLPVPAAFLIWTGPVAGVVWMAVLVLLAASLPHRPRVPALPPRRTAALATLVLLAAAAWRVDPMIPGGDEPHYLVITQSLLLDGDLSIEDVHRRGDYRAYYAGDLPPHVQRRGRDGQIYSVHAPGLPALIAPAFAVAGYPGVLAFLVLLASAGAALAWHVAWLATGRASAAWFGWAAVTLPITAVFQGITVYPDGPGGLLVLTGLWALLRAAEEEKAGTTGARPWLLHGTALALLPWLHTRFAVLAGALGALVLLRLARTKEPAAKAVAFLSVPALSAILWIGFFVAIYGTPDPTAPYGPGEIGSFRFVPGGLGGLLFDQRFGLIAYAPAVAVAGTGLALMIARPGWRRLGLEIAFVAVPYLLTVTHFAMWWGGWSPPARFFTAVLPLFAVPAAVAWTSLRGRASRVLALAALAVTVLASGLLLWVDRGRLAFNTRDAPALWLEWLGRLADLTAAAPMWSRDSDRPLFGAIAIWVAVAAAAWTALELAGRSPRLTRQPVFNTAAGVVLALALMAGTSAMWAVAGVSGLSVPASQLQLLERLAATRRVIALRLDPPAALLPPADVPRHLRLELTRATAVRPAGRDNPPMFAFPPLPAGRYRLRLDAGRDEGWIMVGVARDQFALHTTRLPVRDLELEFPLPVRSLLVRGDEDARRVVRGLVLEPLRIRRPSERLTGEMARRAVRYGTATVYFLDERSFPEPDAFWVGGARESTVVLHPDRARTSLPLRLRNGPDPNRVTLSTGGWAREWRLSGGEEVVAEVPLDPARGGAVLRIGSEAGFRPSEHDPASRDQRFLGVYVEIGS